MMMTPMMMTPIMMTYYFDRRGTEDMPGHLVKKSTVRVFDETLERPHVVAVRQRHSGELPGNLTTEEEVYQLINHPGRIETAELARQLIEWLENAIAGIQAQLDSHNERAQLDWGRRAAYALSIKRSRLERLERRLAQLDGTMQSNVQRKLANAQSNVEAARI